MIIDDFILSVSNQNELQRKYLLKALDNLTEKEKLRFETVLNYYKEKYSFDYIVESYLIIVNDTLRETKYFVENNHYRYSTFKEVSSSVYYNNDYMAKYMVGLAITGFLWVNHLLIHRFFEKCINDITEGDKYLEIGTGHGQYFLEAVNTKKFKNYLGIDLSPTSVNSTIEFVDRFKKDEIDNYHIFCKDFFDLDENEKFDMIVMSEVLEHVEKPIDLLKKLHIILSEKGFAYITIPINAPAIDHIFLFRSIEEIKEMINQSGFKIFDSYIVTANEIPIEKAIKKHMAINVALLLQK